MIHKIKLKQKTSNIKKEQIKFQNDLCGSDKHLVGIWMRKRMEMQNKIGERVGKPCPPLSHMC